ncbi:hypothetical protein A2U01_0090442, partial [Trifolium medium]|nr:hypothetical protein [Trifolium medium]
APRSTALRVAPTPEEKYEKQDYPARRAAKALHAMKLRVAPHECARRARDRTPSLWRFKHQNHPKIHLDML